jgi:hypothetical protein
MMSIGKIRVAIARDCHPQLRHEGTEGDNALVLVALE